MNIGGVCENDSQATLMLCTHIDHRSAEINCGPKKALRQGRAHRINGASLQGFRDGKKSSEESQTVTTKRDKNKTPKNGKQVLTNTHTEANSNIGLGHVH